MPRKLLNYIALFLVIFLFAEIGGLFVKTSNKGIDLIKRFEGLELEAYKCAAGVWTIGYGHTRNVDPDMEITEETAENLLRQDLNYFEKQVDKLVSVEINQNQFDALVSLAYNIGIANLKSSTLLKLLNKGYEKSAALEFPKWRKANGKVLKGLERRRAAEMELFLS